MACSGHPEISDVVDYNMRNLDHLFSAMVTPPVVDLANALTAMLPPQLTRCMFLSTGSETNEQVCGMPWNCPPLIPTGLL